MQKLTLQFLNSKTNIPIVNIPLADGRSINAIIDTGSDSTVYYTGAKETYPELFLKTKSMGKCKVIGVHETKEMDIYVSGIRLNVKQGTEESLPLKLVAFEHSGFDAVMNPLMEQEGMMESIPLLIGSDTLIRYNAKIDMKKKAMLSASWLRTDSGRAFCWAVAFSVFSIWHRWQWICARCAATRKTKRGVMHVKNRLL